MMVMVMLMLMPSVECGICSLMVTAAKELMS